jgi:hypothetical protein
LGDALAIGNLWSAQILRTPFPPATFADGEGNDYGRIDQMDGVESEHGRDRLLNRRDAAAYLTDLGLEMAAQTLTRKFQEGSGPLCTNVGDRAMYWRHHLDEYFEEHLSAPRRSSSEPRVPACRIEQAANEQTPIMALPKTNRAVKIKGRGQGHLAPLSMPLPF